MQPSLQIAVVLMAVLVVPITASATTETISYENGARYVGETRNGKKHGHGVYTTGKRGRYDGQWQDGRIHGRGVLLKENGDRYEGDFRDNKKHGRGVFTWANGNRYEGDFRNDKRHGRGVFAWGAGDRYDGDRYEGDFRDGKKHGHGVYTWPNGNRYEGDFRDDKWHGRGVFAWGAGDRYDGDFREGKRTGRGVYTWPNGNRYEGDFRNGKRTGRGVFTHADGNRWKGGFRDGKRHGQGVFTKADGTRWIGTYAGGTPGRGTWAPPMRSPDAGLHAMNIEAKTVHPFCEKAANLSLGPQVKGFRAVDRHHCAKGVVDWNHEQNIRAGLTPGSFTIYNRCDRQIFFGFCIVKVGQYKVGGGDQQFWASKYVDNPLGRTAACDSTARPYPLKMGFLVPMPRGEMYGPGGAVLPDLAGSEIYWWAFSCED